jgi:hypothetical protein
MHNDHSKEIKLSILIPEKKKINPRVQSCEKYQETRRIATTDHFFKKVNQKVREQENTG